MNPSAKGPRDRLKAGLQLVQIKVPSLAGLSFQDIPDLQG